jgi:hypothetical protein
MVPARHSVTCDTHSCMVRHSSGLCGAALTACIWPGVRQRAAVLGVHAGRRGRDVRRGSPGLGGRGRRPCAAVHHAEGHAVHCALKPGNRSIMPNPVALYGAGQLWTLD